ncbi:hypothetical protein VSR01_00345 [Actinacidiphila sp. DG2A-62]|uniref:hypothetical protein n=1 Tax=Actinacidiphila sp. DG2A-62 TaxID=3108821 RepID=UPI002DB96F46|nr:hypothetical protein [Actinacidiphila sp. DG2A-62]MEC3992078.1 hypothetical protein [Actinacidiphila sp. DG2A-62]
MTNHQIEAVLTAAAVARAYGPDVRRLVRRVLAAGVRTGASELVRSRREHAGEEER